MLSGHEALARALGASRLRRSYGFVGLPLHKLVDGLIARPPQGLVHDPSHSDLHAASLALGGALLSGGGTALLLRAGGINVALEALATLGLMNELHSPQVIVAGFDPGPLAVATAQDDRGVLAQVCHLPQLDPGSPDELYHMTRLATQASRLGGMPVVVRVSSRVLDGSGDVQESAVDPLDPAGNPWPVRFARSAGPYVLSAATYRYHVDKRALRLQQLETLAQALCTQAGPDGPVGVVIAGHLGARAQAKATAYGVPSLRLGTSWPLPRRLLEAFLRDKREVLVLEEGEAFLEQELKALAHSLRLGCQVRGLSGSRPLRLDEHRLDRALQHLGAPGVEPRAEERDPAAWRRVQEALLALSPLDLEPWPMFLARARKKLWGFSAEDPRARLIGAIRAQERPSMIVADPSAAALLGFRDKLIDVKAGFGMAPSVAGALGHGTEVEEQPGAPLAVALLGDLNVYQSSLLGIVDNIVHKRDVLHVILVRQDNEEQLPALDAVLRSLGLPFLSVRLDDPALGDSLKAMIAERGARALLCTGAGNEEAIGG